MRFLSALRRACPISVQQQQQCQQQRVNALWRAYLISTARKERGISHEHAVSMPYVGLLPFLQETPEREDIMNNQCVNALYRASPISTFIKKALGAWYNSVSMPYIGLLPFLP